MLNSKCLSTPACVSGRACSHVQRKTLPAHRALHTRKIPLYCTDNDYFQMQETKVSFAAAQQQQ